MIISTHMPKTAGLSFRATLEECFGAGFRHDYSDYPLNNQPPVRHSAAMEHNLSLAGNLADYAGIECIHGHFLPFKYLVLADHMDCRFVTWMREPVARLVSHYYYWHRAYDAGSDSTADLHRRVVEEEWSLEKFCLAPELRDIYAQFLWGFPPQRLDFIGITEFYEEDLRYFSSTFLGHNTEAQKVNQRDDGMESGLDDGFSARLRAKIQDYHSVDMDLYRRALQARESRPAVAG
ncbi:MAG: hypothetical protein V7754_08625 [Halioglobus sp.]